MNTTSPTQKTLSEFLDEIEQRANAAISGPWELLRINGQMGSHSLAIHSDGQGIICEMNKVQDYYVGNANFIAAARSDVPKLLQIVHEARRRYLAEVGPDSCEHKEYDAALADILSKT